MNRRHFFKTAIGLVAAAATVPAKLLAGSPAPQAELVTDPESGLSMVICTTQGPQRAECYKGQWKPGTAYKPGDVCRFTNWSMARGCVIVKTASTAQDPVTNEIPPGWEVLSFCSQMKP